MKKSRLYSSLFFLILISACVTSRETGRSSFNFMPKSVEDSLGASAYSQIKNTTRVSNNTYWTGILQRVGNRIAAAANQPDFKWEFRLIESSEKNAFCLPGGKVAFYTGIFPVAMNEAGIAVVMGHEVAHATERHGGQRMSVSLSAAGLSIGAMALTNAMMKDNSDTTKQIIFAALGIGTTIGVILPFSRANESEADEVGLKFAARAGYDPREAPKFWSRFASEGGKTPTFLSTHPNSADRARALEAQIPKVMELYERSPKYGVGDKL